ncbi:hypothetical protein EG878_17060, partial [Enterococcus faecalis]
VGGDEGAAGGNAAAGGEVTLLDFVGDEESGIGGFAEAGALEDGLVAFPLEPGGGPVFIHHGADGADDGVALGLLFGQADVGRGGRSRGVIRGDALHELVLEIGQALALGDVVEGKGFAAVLGVGLADLGNGLDAGAFGSTVVLDLDFGHEGLLGFDRGCRIGRRVGAADAADFRSRGSADAHAAVGRDSNA